MQCFPSVANLMLILLLIFVKFRVNPWLLLLLLLLLGRPSVAINFEIFLKLCYILVERETLFSRSMMSDKKNKNNYAFDQLL
jgi:hypothetical protein